MCSARIFSLIVRLLLLVFERLLQLLHDQAQAALLRGNRQLAPYVSPREFEHFLPRWGHQLASVHGRLLLVPERTLCATAHRLDAEVRTERRPKSEDAKRR